MLAHNPDYLQTYMKEIIEYLETSEKLLHSLSMLTELNFNYLFGIRYVKFLWEDIFLFKIAETIQKPTAVRAVATAIAANPLLITIPCHRVIGKNGKLTGFRGGLEMKKVAYIRKFAGRMHMTAKYTSTLTLAVPTEFSFQENVRYLSRSNNECMFHIENNKIYKVIPVQDVNPLVEISMNTDGYIQIRF